MLRVWRQCVYEERRDGKVYTRDLHGRQQWSSLVRETHVAMSSRIWPHIATAMSQRPIVLCGPSGVGKSTLIKRLFEEFPTSFGFSVSHTTRHIRPGEVDGQSYHFVTRDEFERRVQNGEFLEHAVFGGNMYGTTAQAVRDVHEKGAGRRAILDIDAQGVRLIKQNHPDLNPIYVFISPPTFSTLKERLEGRATDSKDAIERRLSMALEELAYARQPDSFDCIIVNQDLAKAYEKLRAVIQGEKSVSSDSVPPEDEAERLRRSS